MGDLRAGGPWLITSVSNLRAELPGQICRLVGSSCLLLQRYIGEGLGGRRLGVWESDSH